jgi:hypothetical protein
MQPSLNIMDKLRLPVASLRGGVVWALRAYILYIKIRIISIWYFDEGRFALLTSLHQSTAYYFFNFGISYFFLTLVL